jgi:hypothetical protein
MVSGDAQTRKKAALDAEKLLGNTHKSILNSPHQKDEIQAIKTLISKVHSEK